MVRPEDLKHFQGANHDSHKHPRQVHNVEKNLVEHAGIHCHLIQVFDTRVHCTVREQKYPASNPSKRHD